MIKVIMKYSKAKVMPVIFRLDQGLNETGLLSASDSESKENKFAYLTNCQRLDLLS